MSPPKPPALPPLTAEFTSVLQPAKPGSPPAQSASSLLRAGDGKTRVDSGTTSLISNPATGETTLLDHVKKTATIQMPAPPAPPSAAMPKLPGLAPPPMPAAPTPPAPPSQDLGKSIMQGHEVEGKKFVIPQPQIAPPALPKIPGMQLPGMPKPPQLPGMPKPPQVGGTTEPPQPPAGLQAPKPPQAPAAPAAPALPPAPAAPKPPTVAEVWTAPKLALPMLTKAKGEFGQLTQTCKSAVPGEPHPSAFQIPPGYKVIKLPPPALPAAPKLPAMLKPPALPKLPPPPKLPPMPKL